MPCCAASSGPSFDASQFQPGWHHTNVECKGVLWNRGHAKAAPNGSTCAQRKGVERNVDPGDAVRRLPSVDFPPRLYGVNRNADVGHRARSARQVQSDGALGGGKPRPPRSAVRRVQGYGSGGLVRGSRKSARAERQAPRAGSDRGGSVRRRRRREHGGDGGRGQRGGDRNRGVCGFAAHHRGHQKGQAHRFGQQRDPHRGRPRDFAFA
mmetsp:Transcript_47355/g.88203  ORF Transcript_47355/g.88203 Transcript_47355/m.88203 type:complete len:209 (-) Transcript_47355:1078-1704(-)